MMTFEREDFPVVALDLPMAAFSSGLLGMDFLRECQAIIDVARAEIQVAIELLSKKFKVPKSHVWLKSGQTSRQKIIEIN